LRLPCYTLIALSVAILATQAVAQGLSPLTPAKEYIRFNGQTVAIENAIGTTPASANVYTIADPRIKSTGEWSSGTSSETGDTQSFSFTGTTVSYVYMMTTPASGLATVTIDGHAVASIDEYSPGECYCWLGYPFSSKIATITGLTNATHTFKVTVSGNKDSASQGDAVWSGDFIVGPIRNDNDPTITYTGSWVGTTGVTAAWNQDEHITSNVGDSATLSFTGSFVTLIYSQSSSGGTLSVSLDNTTIDTINENYPYQSTANPGDPFMQSRSYTGFAPGSHTLTVTAGAAPSGLSGTTVNIDAVIVPQ
jgi:hypothetical protein